MTNKLLHRVAVIYETNVLTVFDIVGDSFILSADDQTQNSNEISETTVVKMQPNLAIIQWQECRNARF